LNDLLLLSLHFFICYLHLHDFQLRKSSHQKCRSWGHKSIVSSKRATLITQGHFGKAWWDDKIVSFIFHKFFPTYWWNMLQISTLIISMFLMLPHHLYQSHWRLFFRDGSGNSFAHLLLVLGLEFFLSCRVKKISSDRVKNTWVRGMLGSGQGQSLLFLTWPKIVCWLFCILRMKKILNP